MSRSRFASITADLLVRKGEAKPWLPPPSIDLPPIVVPQTAPPHRFIEHEPVPVAHEPAAIEPHVPCGPARRCAIRLSECEYQRLGIVAVKRDVTRQQILREAVESYLASAERDYGRGCLCLSGEPG